MSTKCLESNCNCDWFKHQISTWANEVNIGYFNNTTQTNVNHNSLGALV